MLLSQCDRLPAGIFDLTYGTHAGWCYQQHTHHSWSLRQCCFCQCVPISIFNYVSHFSGGQAARFLCMLLCVVNHPNDLATLIDGEANGGQCFSINESIQVSLMIDNAEQHA